MRSNGCRKNADSPRPKITLHRRTRGALLLGTALQAAALLVIEIPARAQPAPGTHPMGGSVVAGQASISTSGATTLINQASQSASINWQSFSVAADQSVVFRQPGSTSIALNRVIGPDPSIIAGRITANGQIVLINQSGVLFTRGSQVDTAGLVVSAAGMSDKNFAAGRLVFDQAAHPGAMVSNAGNITIKQAGLAALVAPQVANSGLITARLGHVVLAGVQTATLDLYGDRLVSLNVTGAVTSVSVGGQTIPALVTNTGTILAPGGTIMLTARDADALVSQLVTAGGIITTDSAGARGGQILVEGVGGSVEISGTLSAQGTGATSKGGAIQVAATGNVVLDPTAAINASGTRGGGTVALGTRLARARHGSGVSKHAASRVQIARGATVRADATLSGAGGRIAVLGQQSVAQAGALSARGAGIGNGGSIELSTNGSLAITGTENAGAALGRAGSITIDPPNVEITNGAPDPGYTAISTAMVDGMTGEVVILAGDTLKLLSSVVLGPDATGFALIAGRDLVLDAGFDAGSLAGTFSAGAGGIQQIAGLVTAGSLDIRTTGALTQSGGAMALGTLSGAASGIALTGANEIRALGSLDSTGAIDIATTGALQVEGAVDAHSNRITLTGASIYLTSPVSATTLDLIATAGDITQTRAGVIEAGTLSASAVAGNGLDGQILLDTAANTISILGTVSAASDFKLTDNAALSQGLTVSGPVTSANGNVTLRVTGDGADLDIDAPIAGTDVTLISAKGAVAEFTGGAVMAATLAASAGTSLALASAANAVGTLARAAAAAGIVLDDTTTLAVAGPVRSRSGAVTLDVTGSFQDLDIAGPVTAATTLDLAATGDIAIGGTLTASGAALNAGNGLITERGGAILLGAGTLTAQAASGITLESTANSLRNLGSSNAGDGAFVLADGAALTVTGQVESAGNLTLDVAGAGHNLTLDGTLSSGTVALNVTGGGVTGTNGRIDAAILTGSAGGNVTLDGSNTIATLTAFTAGGGLALTDSVAPTITGLVSAGQTLALTVASGSSGTLLLAGATILAADLALSTPGDAVQTGGSITVGTLTAAVGGALDLDGGANSIARLGAISTGGNLTLADATGVIIGGPVSAGRNLALSAAGGITIAGALTDTAGITTLRAGGGIVSQEGAAVTLTTLTGSAAGSGGALDLDAGTIKIGTLTDFTAATTIAVADASPLIVAGLVEASGGKAALSASQIDIAGTLALTESGLISLAADRFLLGGQVATPGGTIALSRLTAGVFSVGPGASTAITLTSLRTGSGRVVIGSLDGNAIDPATTSIDFTGAASFNGGAATLELMAEGDITSSGGLAVRTLTAASAKGSIAITGPNAISTLGPINAPGSVIVHDTGALAVAANVTGQGGVALTSSGALSVDAGATVAGGYVSLDASAITLFGTLSATAGSGPGTGTVTLAAPGAIAEAGGSILAATLEGPAAQQDGTLTLLSASNRIGTLGALSSSGDLALRDSSPLTIAGPISVLGQAAITIDGVGGQGGVDLTAAGTLQAGAGLSITAPGAVIQTSGLLASGADIDISAAALDFAGTIRAAGTTALTLGGDLVEASSGALVTPELTGTATGEFLLASPQNSIATIGNLQAGGQITIADQEALTVAGPLASTEAGVALIDAQGLAIDGSLSGGTVVLAASGITEASAGQGSSGSIDAAVLTGNAAGDAALGGDNHIAALGPFSVGGTLNLADNGPLSVTGAVSAGGALGITVQGNLTLLADIGGTGVTLAASGALDQQEGTVQGTGLALSAASIAQSPSGTLALSGAGTVSLASTGAIALGGGIDADQGSVTVSTPSGVTDTGQLGAATLTGTVGGAASFTGGGTGAGNAVAQLDGFSATGGLTLADGVNLAVDGPVSAGGIRLSVGGAGTAMTISGTLLSSGSIALASTRDLTQSAGTIMAATTARLDAAGTISLAGEVSAPTILIGSTRAPALVVWNNNTLLTSSVLSHDQLLDSLPPDNGSQPGIYVRTGSLLQTGTTLINPSGAPATLEVGLTGAGKVTLDPVLTEGLLAPSTFTFFDLAGGTASGQLKVSSLFVEYAAPGATNPTKFTGSVDGIAGTEAAAFAKIGPLPDQEYQLNGCALGAVDCVLLSPVSVPVENPVQEVSFDPPRRRLDDDYLVLPDVAEQDY